MFLLEAFGEKIKHWTTMNWSDQCRERLPNSVFLSQILDLNYLLNYSSSHFAHVDTAKSAGDAADTAEAAGNQRPPRASDSHPRGSV